MSEDRRARRPPLAWRLGLIFGAVVLAVLLIVGLLVNRVVSGGFQTVLAGQQQQRVDDAAITLSDRLDRPVRVQALVRRLATDLGGVVTVLSPDGTVISAFGTAPDGVAATYTASIDVDGQPAGTVRADLPVGVGDRGFLPLFNGTLVVGGILSVIGIALASVYVANRLTRPLRDVADAARRLEAGEAAARATGGDDQESAELAEAFNAMADRLERSEMLRRRAASDIAHDLATPATVLVSQLQAMVDGVVPADREGLEAARSAASALGSVVAQMSDLSSAEAAPLQASPVDLDLGAVVRDVESALDGLRRDRGVALETSVAGRAGGPRGPWPPHPGAPQCHRQRDLAQPAGRSRRRGRLAQPRSQRRRRHRPRDRPGCRDRGGGCPARVRAVLPCGSGTLGRSVVRATERKRDRVDHRP